MLCSRAHFGTKEALDSIDPYLSYRQSCDCAFSLMTIQQASWIDMHGIVWFLNKIAQPFFSSPDDAPAAAVPPAPTRLRSFAALFCLILGSPAVLHARPYISICNLACGLQMYQIPAQFGTIIFCRAPNLQHRR